MAAHRPQVQPFGPWQVLGLEAQPSAPHDKGSSHGLTRIIRCAAGITLQHLPASYPRQPLKLLWYDRTCTVTCNAMPPCTFKAMPPCRLFPLLPPANCCRKCYFEHPSYVPLLHESYRLWNELEAETGEVSKLWLPLNSCSLNA